VIASDLVAGRLPSREDLPMVWIAPEVTRTKTIWVADERACIESYLDRHRDTLLEKCSGLNGDQLVMRAVPTSDLTLLGLVRHMALVERVWFRKRFGKDEDLEDLYVTDECPNGEFDLVEADKAEADFSTYAAEVATIRGLLAGRSLDETFPELDSTMNLRWVYLHILEEYARHNGHADLLREGIDGKTGH
jgi:uncharacterized damage-inducible protein DinB